MTVSKIVLSIILPVVLVCVDISGAVAQENGQYKNMATEMLAYINIHRTKMGLKPLKMNGMITAAAQQHTFDMATKTIPFGHDGFNERMKKLYKEMKPVYSFAENVAMGPHNAKEVVAQWLNSKEHKENIEREEYNFTGIGIARGVDSNLYFTEIFIAGKDKYK